MTKGKDGVLLSDTTQGLFSQNAIPIQEIKDTTGAGDAFAAGFLTRFEQTHIYVSPAKQPDEVTLRECVISGHQLAARVLRSAGATMEAR